MVQVNADGGPEWTVAERLLPADLDEWKDEKHSGPGRDPRLLPVLRDSDKARFRSLREAMNDATYIDQKNPPEDWPFRGPSATKELLTAVRASGEELQGYPDHFMRISGLNPDHPVAIKYRELFVILVHLLAFDQVNPGNSAGVEILSRLVLQVQTAVRRSPKNPDFKGTSLMAMSQLDSAGGILTGEFARFLAEEQKSHAFTLKQQRLFAEEEEKRKNKGGKDPKTS